MEMNISHFFKQCHLQKQGESCTKQIIFKLFTRLLLRVNGFTEMVKTFAQL